MPRLLRPLIRRALLEGQRRPAGIPRRRWLRELRRICPACSGAGDVGIGLYLTRRCRCCGGEGWR